MTHIGVCPELKQKLGITDQLIRLSVGVENSADLIRDIEQALKGIQTKGKSTNAKLVIL
jgi:cystathionine beta-lyase/cystathionine gamma-synthase